MPDQYSAGSFVGNQPIDPNDLPSVANTTNQAQKMAAMMALQKLANQRTSDLSTQRQILPIDPSDPTKGTFAVNGSDHFLSPYEQDYARGNFVQGRNLKPGAPIFNSIQVDGSPNSAQRFGGYKPSVNVNYGSIAGGMNDPQYQQSLKDAETVRQNNEKNRFEANSLTGQDLATTIAKERLANTLTEQNQALSYPERQAQADAAASVARAKGSAASGIANAISGMLPGSSTQQANGLGNAVAPNPADSSGSSAPIGLTPQALDTLGQLGNIAGLNPGAAPIDISGNEYRRNQQGLELTKAKQDAAKVRVSNLIKSGDFAGARSLANQEGVPVGTQDVSGNELPIPTVDEYVANNRVAGRANLEEAAKAFSGQDVGIGFHRPTTGDVKAIIGQRDRLVDEIVRRTGADKATAKDRANQIITDAMREQNPNYNSSFFGGAMTKQLLAELAK